MEIKPDEYESVRWYSGLDAYDFNRRLRQSIPLTPEQSVHYDRLWTFLDKNRTTEELVVRRGVTQMTPKEVRAILDLPQRSFLSTTLNKMSNAVDMKCCTIVIRVPIGSPACNISAYSLHPGENEVLLAPGRLSYIRKRTTRSLWKPYYDVAHTIYECEYIPDPVPGRLIKKEKVKEKVKVKVKKEKICKEGYENHPSDRKKCRKSCTNLQVRHPHTGRCRKISKRNKRSKRNK